MKKLYILIGPKGSGKTYIGSLLERELGITFLRVEPIWKKLQKGKQPDETTLRRGFAAVESALDALAENRIAMETTGAGPFAPWIEHLRSKYAVKLVHVDAPQDVCMYRIRHRERSIHIPVSDDRIEEVNRLSRQASFPYDLELHNTDLSEKEILTAFKRIY